MSLDMKRLCEAAQSGMLDGGLWAVPGEAERIVRAVLSALREPSEAMIEAGTEGRKAVDSILARPNTLGTWQAMIDAALVCPQASEQKPGAGL